MQPNSRRPDFGTLCAVALTLAIASFQVTAAPTSVMVSGAFDNVTGTFSTDGLYIGQGYSATFVFDTDEAAASYSQLTPSTEPNDYFTRAYTFDSLDPYGIPNGKPYGVNATANGRPGGGFHATSTGVRMSDNRYISSAQSGGLIADGVYDLAEFQGSQSTGVCLLPDGCTSTYEYTPTGGTEISFYVLADSGWFGGGMVQQLPNSPLLTWIDVTTYENGAVVGKMRGFASATTMSAVPALPMAPVPEPETYAMFLAGLMMVGAVARRRGMAA